MRWTRRSNLDRVRSDAPGHAGASGRGKHCGMSTKVSAGFPRWLSAVAARGILGSGSS